MCVTPSVYALLGNILLASYLNLLICGLNWECWVVYASAQYTHAYFIDSKWFLDLMKIMWVAKSLNQ